MKKEDGQREEEVKRKGRRPRTHDKARERGNGGGDMEGKSD